MLKRIYFLCFLGAFCVNSSSFSMDQAYFFDLKKYSKNVNQAYQNILKSEQFLNTRIVESVKAVHYALEKGNKKETLELVEMLEMSFEGISDKEESFKKLNSFCQECRTLITKNQDQEDQDNMVPFKEQKENYQNNIQKVLLKGKDKRLTNTYFDDDDRSIEERLQTYIDMGNDIDSILFANTKDRESVSPAFFECAFLKDARENTNFKITPMIHIGSIQFPFEWDNATLMETKNARLVKNYLNQMNEEYGNVLGIFRTSKVNEAGHYYSFFLEGKKLTIINPAGEQDTDSDSQEYTALAQFMQKNIEVVRTGMQSGNTACGISAYMITKAIAIVGDVDGYKNLIFGVNNGLIKTNDDFIKLPFFNRDDTIRKTNLFKNLEKEVAMSVLNFVKQ